MKYLNVNELPRANFPDGHKHIVIPDDFVITYNIDTFKIAIRNFDDLFLLAQAKEIFEFNKVRITYLLGARCDRRFSNGEAFDLKIVANFINNLGFELVEVIHPHSLKTQELIRNCSPVYPIERLYECYKQNNLNLCHTIVAPDYGASQWIRRYFKESIVTGKKIRDINDPHHPVVGVDFDAPNTIPSLSNYVIVDDLCDGGGTFIAVANELRKRGAKKIDLIVTHGIFSKGFSVFNGVIDHIYTTNSWEQIDIAGIPLDKYKDNSRVVSITQIEV